MKEKVEVASVEEKVEFLAEGLAWLLVEALAGMMEDPLSCLKG